MQGIYNALRLTKTVWLTAVIFTSMLLVQSPFAEAQDDAANHGWEWHILPYMWAISMDGNATVKGLEADVDVGFSDIWDELNFAVMIEYEARKGRWGLWGNTIYANVGDSDVGGPVGLTKIAPTVTTFYQGLGGFYRVGTWKLGQGAEKTVQSIILDAYFGGRLTLLDLKIDFEGIFQGRRDDLSKQKSWVEPLVGARTIWNLTRQLSVVLSGDIGGFGVGSDFAWQTVGLLGYQFDLFGKDNARFIAGYRVLSQDYSDGNGRDKFQWDVTLHGPILGLQIQF